MTIGIKEEQGEQLTEQDEQSTMHAAELWSSNHGRERERGREEVRGHQGALERF